MVKIGGSKKRKLNANKDEIYKFCGNKGRDIYKFCGNRWKYSIRIIGLGGMDIPACMKYLVYDL